MNTFWARSGRSKHLSLFLKGTAQILGRRHKEKRRLRRAGYCDNANGVKFSLSINKGPNARSAY